MRSGSLEIVRGFSTLFAAREPIVEIGSFLVADAQRDAPDIRSFYPGRRYLGVDMRPGPRVDQVEDFEKGTSFADGSVGTIITCDTLEHVFDTFRFMAEVNRILAPGGMLFMASVMYYPIHSHPFDYWRFTPEAFRRLAALVGEPLVLTQGPADFPYTVVAVVRKGGSLSNVEKSRFTDLVVAMPESLTRCNWRHPDHIAASRELCRHLFDASRRVLFDSRENPRGIAAFLTSAELTLEQAGSQITVKSAGNDPHFLLPLLDTTGARAILMRLVLESAVPSFLQVYYIGAGEDIYSESDSLIEEVRAGHNDILIRLPAINPGGRLRIDPLARTGELTFLSLEVRGC